MEQTLIKLQDLQRRAFMKGVASFEIRCYNWDDTPESPTCIAVSARLKDDDTEDDYRAWRFYADTDSIAYHDTFIEEIANFTR